MDEYYKEIWGFMKTTKLSLEKFKKQI